MYVYLCMYSDTLREGKIGRGLGGCRDGEGTPQREQALCKLQGTGSPGFPFPSSWGKSPGLSDMAWLASRFTLALLCLPSCDRLPLAFILPRALQTAGGWVGGGCLRFRCPLLRHPHNSIFTTDFRPVHKYLSFSKRTENSMYGIFLGSALAPGVSLRHGGRRLALGKLPLSQVPSKTSGPRGPRQLRRAGWPAREIYPQYKHTSGRPLVSIDLSAVHTLRTDCCYQYVLPPRAYPGSFFSAAM